MSDLRWIDRPVRMAARFAGNESGVSAVEFALVLPVMLIMYLGTVEVSQAISVDRKMTLAASTMANIAGMMDKVHPISDAYNGGIMAGKSTYGGVAKIDPTKIIGSVTVVSVDVKTKKVTVQCTWPTGTYTNGQDITAAIGDLTAFITNSGLTSGSFSLAWGQAKTTYTPTIGYVLTGSLTLSDTAVMALRQSFTQDMCS